MSEKCLTFCYQGCPKCCGKMKSRPVKPNLASDSMQVEVRCEDCGVVGAIKVPSDIAVVER